MGRNMFGGGPGPWIESALEQARAAAGGKEMSLGGGASVAQQYLAAGLLDEIVVSVVPILLGGGARLFENVGDVKLEQVESVEAPGTMTATLPARRFPARVLRNAPPVGHPFVHECPSTDEGPTALLCSAPDRPLLERDLEVTPPEGHG